MTPSITERPVMRDPRTGKLNRHPAFTTPEPAKLTVHGLGFVLMGAALAAAIVSGAGL